MPGVDIVFQKRASCLWLFFGFHDPRARGTHSSLGISEIKGDGLQVEAAAVDHPVVDIG